MGLDVTAYKNLTEVKNPVFDEYGDLENWEEQFMPGNTLAYTEKYFPGRTEGLSADETKVYEAEDEFGFRAGAYSCYNRFRERLSHFARNSEFYELIAFFDCDGCIGPVVSQKLYNDFKNNEDRAIKFSKRLADNIGEDWLRDYREWMKAFEYAAQNGAVNFH